MYTMNIATTQGYGGIAGSEQSISPIPAMVSLLCMISAVVTSTIGVIKNRSRLTIMILTAIGMVSVLDLLYAIFGR